MHLSSEPDRSKIGSTDGAPAPVARSGDGEEIDALPVLADRPTVVRPYPFAGALARDRSSAAVIPSVQAVAVAAGGVVAGAAVVGLVQRRQRRSPALSKGRRLGRVLGRGGRGGQGSRAGDRAGELVQIVGSRSLLVDVHLLGGRD